MAMLDLGIVTFEVSVLFVNILAADVKTEWNIIK